MSPGDEAVLQAFQDCAIALVTLPSARDRLRVINALVVLVQGEVEGVLEKKPPTDEEDPS